MIRVAIVEDRPEEQAHIEACLDFLAQQEQVEFSVSKYSTGDEFLFHFERNFDIVLMDIEMPGRSGLETAKALRQIDEDVVLIFLTALAQYALEGYEVDALSYIVKPIRKYDFAMKLSRAVHRTAARHHEKIPIRTENELLLISASSIRYAEVRGHYVTWHTDEASLDEYTTLKGAEEKLKGAPFVRCCRYYLVNLRYVTAVNDDEVILGQDHLMLAQAQRKTFLTALSKYMGGIRA